MPEVSIDKSVTDKKLYRIITLPNELRVVIVSDKNTHNETDDSEDSILKSAAALCINVGSFNEPIELQGLAHYLEHMVFMGSSKYPTENDFDSSVSQYGGFSNAWTDAERTLFYFDSHKNHFIELVDKFANFFICPLLSKDSMDREVTAVNSEFEMSYSKDITRFEHFIGCLSRKDNPYGGFGMGNQRSLKTIPMSNNIDIYGYLQEFRKKKYSSHYMTLAIQSRESLDDIEKYVREIFSNIPNNGLPKPDMSMHRDPFNTTEFNRFYNIVPIRDVKKLVVTWHLPPLVHEYKSKSLEMISHILGHEGEGSLTDYFRSKNLIMELSTGVYSEDGFKMSSICTLYQMHLSLTDQGFNSVKEIIEKIYSYINILQCEEISEKFYTEFAQLNANNFMYKEEDEPCTTVERLAVNMHLFEDQHLNSGSYIMFERKPELIKSIISHFTVKNMNVCLLSRAFQLQTDHLTEWYDVEHSFRDYKEEELLAWQSPKKIPELYLPKENKFLATDFTMIELEKGNSTAPIDLSLEIYPELCQYGELWYKLDENFRIPKGCLDFYFYSQELSESPVKAAMLEIIVYGVNQQLNRLAYDATVVGLTYSVSVFKSGILISMDGFSHKLQYLYTIIIDHLVNFVVSKIQLSIYKEAIRRSYVNYSIQSNCLRRDIVYRVINKNVWMKLEKLNVLDEIDEGIIQSFHANLLQNSNITAYCHGNLSKETASSCFQYAVDNLKIEPRGRKVKNSMRLVSGQNKLRVFSLNPTDVNTCVDVFHQIPNMNIDELAKNRFLTHILSETCFDYLRTKETLGYSVGIYERSAYDLYGMGVYVISQATKFSVDHCNEKIHTFIFDKAREFIQELSEDDFDEYKMSFIANLLEEDTKMNDEENRNWTEILSSEYVFNRRSQIADRIQEVSKNEMVNFYKQNYLHDNVRKMTVEIDAEEQEKKKSKNLYNNLSEKDVMKLEYFEDTEKKIGLENFCTIESIIARSESTVNNNME